MKAMARRLKRLEMRVGDDDPAGWPIERLLPELASCLCAVPASRLRELMREPEPDAAVYPLPDRERLGLAISRGEEEAFYAAIGTGGEALQQGARAVEEVFAEVFEDWQRRQEARRASGAEVGPRLAGLACASSPRTNTI